jgi:signal transduction histidine kinase
MENKHLAENRRIDELSKLQESIKTFIHDISSPLSAIWGYTNLAILWLKNENGSKDELSEFLDEINKHMKEIEQLTKNTSALLGKFDTNDWSASLEKVLLDRKKESDILETNYISTKRQDIMTDKNLNVITSVIMDLINRDHATANVHINEEDITGTEVMIRQVGSDYMQAVLPKNMGFYMLIPASSIYYVKVKPSTNHIDIYMR